MVSHGLPGDAPLVRGAAESDADVAGTGVAGCDGGELDDTVVVAGLGGAADETVVVVRAGEAPDETVVVDRKSAPGVPAGAVDDATVVVGRGSAGGPGSGVDASAAADATVVVPRAGAQIISDDVLRVLPSRRGGRRVRPAPVEPDFGRQAVDAPGAGAVDTYMPRAVAAPPRALQPSRSSSAVAAARTAAEAALLPSVDRSSARLGWVGVASCVVACVVSVLGVVVIVTALVR